MQSLQYDEIIEDESNINYENKNYKSSSETLMTMNNKYNNLLNTRYHIRLLQKKKMKPKKSYGIIALKTDDIKLYNLINEFLSNIKKSLYIHNGLKCNSINNIKNFIHIKENLRFLLISKKFSYAYYDFIHSKYNLCQNGKIAKLLNEMSQSEFDSILTKSYKDLWNTLHTTRTFFPESEKKFNEVRKKIKANDLLLNKDHFLYPEWEFPKGAKNDDDVDDINTAIREFKEETNLNDNDFIVYSNISPIIENFIGSDENNYTYYYYIALINPNVVIDKKYTLESDNIGFYSYDTAYNYFNRPIQCERRRILECIFNDIINWLNKKVSL